MYQLYYTIVQRFQELNLFSYKISNLEFEVVHQFISILSISVTLMSELLSNRHHLPTKMLLFVKYTPN